MSADNWTTCPRCVARGRAAKERQQAEAINAYGKVPPEEWKRLNAEAQKEFEPESSLREDYCFSLNDEGEFTASYRCRCLTCGFEFKFEHKEQVSIADDKEDRRP